MSAIAEIQFEQKVMQRTQDALAKVHTFKDVQTNGVTADVLLPAYYGEGMEAAKPLTQHYSRVFAELYPGLIELHRQPLTPHVDQDVASVLAKAASELLTVLSGADPMTEFMTPFETLNQGRGDISAFCHFLPSVAFVRSTGEYVITMRIAFHRKPEGRLDFEPYHARTIFPGRHYGRAEAVMR